MMLQIAFARALHDPAAAHFRALETKVLDGLKHQLMRPEMVRTFVDEFHPNAIAPSKHNGRRAADCYRSNTRLRLTVPLAVTVDATLQIGLRPEPWDCPAEC